MTDHRTEPPLILGRGDEGAGHAAIVTRFPIADHVQPEVVTVNVRIPSQVAKIFNQNKRLIVLRLIER